MKKQTFSVIFIISLLLIAVAGPAAVPLLQGEAHAQAKLPTYIKGGGNVKTRMIAKGKTATELIALLAVMLGTAAVIVGGIKLGMNNKQGGKELIIGGVSCLLIVGMAYGVANLVVK
ncbi:MAG: hypothetical protein ACE5FY_04080 [Nitrospiria bacterium]